MPPFLRSAIFAIFALVFLVSAPVLVLYTAGYRFDMGSGRIVHTAALNIGSAPRGATIMIDGKEMPERTPVVLERILPGEHEVQLVKDGYLPWSRRLTFESRQAVIMQDIPLYLDAQLQSLQTIDPINTSVDPTGTRLAYVTQASSWIEVWVTDGPPESTKLLMRLPYEAGSDYDLGWSKDGTYLSLASGPHGSSRISIAKIDDGTNVGQGIGPGEFWWDAGDDGMFFGVGRDGALFRVPITNMTNVPLPYQAARVRSFAGRDVFWEESNNRVVLSFFDGTAASIITYLPLGNYEFHPAPAGLIALYDAGRARYVLLDTGNREQPILLNEEATHFAWNATGDAMLFTGGHDLKLYRQALHQTQTLTRLSEAVDRIGWDTSSGAALYQSGGRTIAVRVNEPPPATQTTLIQGAEGAFWVRDGELYVLDHEKEIKGRKIK